MAVSESARLVTFDADSSLAAVRDVTDDAVLLSVEYTPEEFHVLHADEVTLSLYADREAMEDHFSEVHSYVHVDFTERELFEELFRGAGTVRSFVTVMEHVILVRVLVDGEGIYFTLAPDADATAAVEAVEAQLR